MHRVRGSSSGGGDERHTRRLKSAGLVTALQDASTRHRGRTAVHSAARQEVRACGASCGVSAVQPRQGPFAPECQQRSTSTEVLLVRYGCRHRPPCSPH